MGLVTGRRRRSLPGLGTRSDGGVDDTDQSTVPVEFDDETLSRIWDRGVRTRDLEPGRLADRPPGVGGRVERAGRPATEPGRGEKRDGWLVGESVPVDVDDHPECSDVDRVAAPVDEGDGAVSGRGSRHRNRVLWSGDSVDDAEQDAAGDGGDDDGDRQSKDL